MDFRILGSLEVLEGERVLDVGGGKQRSVLALLLLHANQVVPTDRLIDELWPNEAPPSAPKIIQVHVSRLRKALDGAGEGVLITRGHGYELRIASGELDLDRFRALLEDGRAALAAHDPRKAADRLREALALWRGPPLAEFAYESFAQEEIARLEELHLAAVEERIEADLALGRHDAVVHELEELVARHPLRERLRGQLMLALYRSGRQVEALEVYRDARRTFADDLGLEPSPRLQQLERAILAHDQAVQAPEPQPSPQRQARRKGGLLIAAGALLIVAAAVAVIELTGNQTPAGLAAVAADSVGVIDPDTNRIVAQIPVGSAPSAIEFGRSGVWVISGHDQTVWRIDPTTRTALRALPLGGPPVDVAVDDRAVWVLVSTRTGLAGGPARVARIDPKLKDIVETIRIRTAGLGFGSGPVQTLATSAGSVWVYTPYPRAEVSRIDTTMNTVAASFDASDPTFGFNSGTAGGVPGASGIAVQKEAVWVGSDLGVIRIAAHLKAVSASLRLGVVIPTALAVDEHTIWVVGRPGFRCCPPEDVGIGTLTRINAATNSVEATIPIGGNPTAIAIGEGSVWIADPGTRSVVRVDPRKNRVAERIRIGGRPRGITVGDGLVWISVG
jgi:YVTN family beta-propeller protein